MWAVWKNIKKENIQNLNKFYTKSAEIPMEYYFSKIITKIFLIVSTFFGFDCYKKNN